MEKILIGDSYPKHYIREPGSNLCTCHFYLIPFCTKEKKYLCISMVLSKFDSLLLSGQIA